MKQKFTVSFVLLFAALFNYTPLFAQLTLPAGGGNLKAAVSEYIGLNKVTVNYDRPGVKGREGKIWGQLVHTGFADLDFGTSKAAPWRAGSNENTTIEFTHDVMIEGKTLPAGKYAVFMAYYPVNTLVIFSKNHTSWGSYFYDQKEDALRVTVKPVMLDKSVEWLTYSFTDQTANSATLALDWEKLRIPVKITANVVQDQLTSFRNELRSDKGFGAGAWLQAARFCADNNVNLEEALAWTEKALTDRNIGGEKNFNGLSTKAQLLAKSGKGTEAALLMKEALTMGTMQEIHAYGRMLLSEKKAKEAFDVFKLNYEKNPGQFTTMMGMVRGYSAIGDYKNALALAEKAEPVAPDKLNKDNVGGMIKLLKDGKDVN